MIYQINFWETANLRLVGVEITMPELCNHNMALYRIYLLDQQGRIFFGEDIMADEDEAALAIARQRADAHNQTSPRNFADGVEVWLERKLIYSSID